MRIHRSTLLAAALVAAAALPAAAQGSYQEQQRLAQEHERWHQRNDYLRNRDPREYQARHAREHQELNQAYQRWQRQVGTYQNRGTYGQNGWYDRNGTWHPAGQQQNGWYDQSGRWHPATQQQNGWYDQSGRWHPADQRARDRDDNDDYNRRGNNPKAEGRHDNGKHKGEYKRERGHDRDD